MSRFATNPVAPAPPRPDTRTAQGGQGFTKDAKDQLFTLGIANFVGADTFYESGAARDKRFVDLIHEVTRIDPVWVASFAAWLRSGANMRTASVIVAAEYVKAGGPYGRQVVASVLKRPDEPAEMLGYWMSTHGIDAAGRRKSLPRPIQRGIGDAVRRMYTERNVLKYDGTNDDIRFADVIRMVGPETKDPRQRALFHYLDAKRRSSTTTVDVAGRVAESLAALPTIAEDRRLMALPEGERRANLGAAIEAGWSWERLGSWLPGGMDAEAWEAVIPNMGVMALLRNLRNFDEKNVGGAAVDLVRSKLTDEEEVRRSRVFPLRFMQAWKAVSSVRWAEAMETGLNLSLGNIPYFEGRTLVLIDGSGSMNAPVASKRTDSGKGGHVPTALTRWEAGGLFGCAVAQRSDAADVVLFHSHVFARLDMARHDSILRTVEGIRDVLQPYGTDIHRSLAEAYHGHDRVLIFTDEQTGGRSWDSVAGIKVPVYTWNLAGYETGHAPSHFANWQTYGGLSDAAFNMLGVNEARRSGGWPWEG